MVPLPMQMRGMRRMRHSLSHASSCLSGPGMALPPHITAADGPLDFSVLSRSSLNAESALTASRQLDIIGCPSCDMTCQLYTFLPIASLANRNTSTAQEKA